MLIFLFPVQERTQARQPARRSFFPSTRGFVSGVPDSRNSRKSRLNGKNSAASAGDVPGGMALLFTTIFALIRWSE